MSSHGVSAKTGAKSGATNADQFPVCGCSAGTSAAWRAGCCADASTAGIKPTRPGSTSGRNRSRRPSRNACARETAIGSASENQSCRSSVPETAMAGAGNSSSAWTPCHTRERNCQLGGLVSANTMARTWFDASMRTDGCVASAGAGDKGRYRRCSSDCRRFMRLGPGCCRGARLYPVRLNRCTALASEAGSMRGLGEVCPGQDTSGATRRALVAHRMPPRRCFRKF